MVLVLEMMNSHWLMMAAGSLSGTMHKVANTHTLAGVQVVIVLGVSLFCVTVYYV